MRFRLQKTYYVCACLPEGTRGGEEFIVTLARFPFTSARPRILYKERVGASGSEWERTRERAAVVPLLLLLLLLYARSDARRHDGKDYGGAKRRCNETKWA